MHDTITHRLRHSWPRLAAAAAVMGGLVWLLWPDSHWNPEGEAAITLAGAVAVWLYFELIKSRPSEAPIVTAAEEARAPHPHDLALFDQFNETYSAADRHYLGEHDFRMPLDGRRLDGLELVSRVWAGADFEFHDEPMQTAFRHLQRRGSELFDVTGRKLFMSDNNPNVLSPLTDMDRARGVSQETRRGIDEMNAKAAELSDATNNFLRLARDRLRLD